MAFWGWTVQFGVSFLAISLGAVFSYVLATWRQLRMEDERRKTGLAYLENLYEEMEEVLEENVGAAGQAPQAYPGESFEHIRTTFWEIHQEQITSLEPRDSVRLKMASFFEASQRLSHWLDLVRGMEDSSGGRVSDTLVSARQHRNDAARTVEKLGNELLEEWSSIMELDQFFTDTSFIDAAKFCLLGRPRQSPHLMS